MRDTTERLRDIVDAIARIEDYAARGRAAFEADELIQVWIVHHLQIIGEAAARLGREFQAAHPIVPWLQLVAMRNVLVHDYFGIDIDTVWNVVELELPTLKTALEQLIADLERHQP